MSGFPSAEESRFRCPGCLRVIDGSDLRPGERFKCTKCKKLMRFGPHLMDPNYGARWRAWRSAMLLGCFAATVWCVTAGYDFGMKTGRWSEGFGGALAVWLLAAGCIGLAAMTTQNSGVVVGVAAAMAGVALFFLDRLGRYVGYDVDAWREFRFFDWWAPILVAAGLAGLAVSLVAQTWHRSL